MTLSVLGALTIAGPDGAERALPTRKTALALAALGFLGEAGAARDALAEWIWPDRSEGQARTSLRSALAALRKVLPDVLEGYELEAGRDRLRLIGPEAQIDARAFEALAKSSALPDRLSAAELYGGDLLDGVDLPEGLAVLAATHRQSLRRLALTLVEDLSVENGLTPGQRPICAALADRLLAADPAAEPAHRALIRLRLAQGETNAARRQFELCVEAVRRELSAEPEAQTRALIEALDVAPPTAATPVSQIDATPPLRRAASAPRDSGRPSLAVMPFDGIGLAEDDTLVDGVVEEITAALSRVRDFFVIARQSAYAYKGRFVDARDVGRELGVRYLVEGTVRCGGERLRITVQLVETEGGAQLWSDRYEGGAVDLFDLQDRIASHVAGALSPSIRSSEIELARRTPPENLMAYDLFLRALPHFWAHRKEDNAVAIELLDQALAKDPEYGAALAFKAWCHAQQAAYLWGEDLVWERAHAIATANRAALFVGEHSNGLVAIGAALTLTTADVKLAATFIDRGLAIDPNNAWGWMRAGWLHAMSNASEDAIRCLERALELSPFDPFRFNFLLGIAAAHARSGDLPKALDMAEAGLRAGPGMSWAYRMLASIHARMGAQDKAEAAMARFLAEHPGVTVERLKTGVAPLMLKDNPAFLEGLRKAGLPER